MLLNYIVHNDLQVRFIVRRVVRMDLRGVEYPSLRPCLGSFKRQASHSRGAADREIDAHIWTGNGREVPSSLCLFASIYRHRDGGRVNGPYTASIYALVAFRARPFPCLLTPDHVSSDHFFHRTSHPWPSSFYTVTSPTCVSFHKLLLPISRLSYVRNNFDPFQDLTKIFNKR